MSRCFPFPPPGYEEKIRPEEADFLLKEEKNKEKKQNNEKKDKEKNKDKHKEQKERKDKHKDRKDKDRDKEKSRITEDKKGVGVLSNTGDREEFVTNALKKNGNGESKFIQDLGRRIRDNEAATEIQSPQKIEFSCGVTESNSFCSVPHINHRKIDEKKISTHRAFATAKWSESAVLQVSSCKNQKGSEIIVKSVEDKDKGMRKMLQAVITSQKQLDNEGIKKNETKKVTDRSSEEKKSEKTEVTNKNVQEKQREHNSVDARDFRVQHVSKAGDKNLTAERILGKRKDVETNGLLYMNGFRLDKIQKLVPCSISSMQNGKRLGTGQTHSKVVSELQETVSNPEVKEHKTNGFINSREHKSHQSVSSVKVKENSEASTEKLPHSDLMYLDHILKVPKRKELNEVDDDKQEWLFGESGVRLLKKQRFTSLVEHPQVWNQALRIASADVVAFPYVLPF